jgi:hypothetical protein
VDSGQQPTVINCSLSLQSKTPQAPARLAAFMLIFSTSSSLYGLENTQVQRNQTPVNKMAVVHAFLVALMCLGQVCSLKGLIRVGYCSYYLSMYWQLLI